jgi:prolyl oligopeptidase
MHDPLVTFDEKYLLVQITKDTNPVNLIKFAEISNEKFDKKINLKPLISNWVGKFSYIYNNGTKFYFLTNYKAPKGRIVMIDLNYFDHRDPSLSLFEVIPQH